MLERIKSYFRKNLKKLNENRISCVGEFLKQTLSLWQLLYMLNFYEKKKFVYKGFHEK